jgi:predicted DsbA family dithiol-disulfide isomerase
MGVEIHLPPVSPQPHTHLAWEGFQFARDQHRGSEYNHRVLEAFFRDGLDVGDPAVLTRLAGEVGLDPAEFREALTDRRYRESHQMALREAYARGLTGVPAFDIGGQMLVGLQSKERLEESIEQASRRPSDRTAMGRG